MIKNLLISGVILSSAVTFSAFAETITHFKGSDTMAGILTDAIIASGLNTEITYEGGGSGLAETAIVNGEQGIAPMSRALKPEAIAALKAKGVTPVAHVLALDGIGIFVHESNTIAGIDLATLKAIYTCKMTKCGRR